jgi:hypothetical protein
MSVHERHNHTAAAQWARPNLLPAFVVPLCRLLSQRVCTMKYVTDASSFLCFLVKWEVLCRTGLLVHERPLLLMKLRRNDYRSVAPTKPPDRFPCTALSPAPQRICAKQNGPRFFYFGSRSSYRTASLKIEFVFCIFSMSATTTSWPGPDLLIAFVVPLFRLLFLRDCTIKVCDLKILRWLLFRLWKRSSPAGNTVEEFRCAERF